MKLNNKDGLQPYSGQNAGGYTLEALAEITANGDIKIVRNDITIHGNQAKYDTINNLLFVYGNVEVIRNKNIIVCDELILDLENSTSIMKSKSKKRVEATIFNN